MTTINAAFQWKCQPEAENLINRILDECKGSNSFIAALEHDLLTHTSTRLFDWVDHVVIGHSAALEEELEKYGFVTEVTMPFYRVYHHPGAQLPTVVVKEHASTSAIGVALSVESIA